MEHTYNISINCTNKNIGQRFIDFLGRAFFNSKPLKLKKNAVRFNHKSNHRITIVMIGFYKIYNFKHLMTSTCI